LANEKVKFMLISGLGWLLDFSVYLFCFEIWKLSIEISIVLGIIPAVTFVFILSTTKIFRESIKKRWSLKKKYMVYIFYQGVLTIVISLCAKSLYICLVNLGPKDIYIFNDMGIIVKIIITPITLACNYIVMKFLVESV
jgi:putative flippase GtrA